MNYVAVYLVRHAVSLVAKQIYITILLIKKVVAAYAELLATQNVNAIQAHYKNRAL